VYVLFIARKIGLPLRYKLQDPSIHSLQFFLQDYSSHLCIVRGSMDRAGGYNPAKSLLTGFA
jgi:hypothetical protein